MGISVSPSSSRFEQVLPAALEDAAFQDLSYPQAPVAAIKDQYNLPEMIPYCEDSLYVTHQGVSLALEGELRLRRALAWSYKIEDKGSDKQLVGAALEKCLDRYPNFPRAFRDLLTHLAGEISLIAIYDKHIYAGCSLETQETDLLVGQNESGLQAISTDPRGLYRCGAREIQALEPHQMIQLGLPKPSVVGWSFPRSNR